MNPFNPYSGDLREEGGPWEALELADGAPVSENTVGGVWTAFAEAVPPKPTPPILVTNNISAVDRWGFKSHVWLVRSYVGRGDGEILSFDGGCVLRNLTHWRFALPEDSQVAVDSAPVNV